MASYIAVIRKEPHTDYWVDAPDIPGCVAGGHTLPAARENFRKALAAHLEGGDDPNMRRPPRSLEEIDAEELEGAAGTFIVEL